MRAASSGANAKFTGFGRSATDKDGVFGFDTISRARRRAPAENRRAPHIVVCIFSRGMLRQLYTRIYFADEAANAADPVLSLVPSDRRETLIAHKQGSAHAPSYRFDIRVQGDNERFSSTSELVIGGGAAHCGLLPCRETRDYAHYF